MAKKDVNRLKIMLAVTYLEQRMYQRMMDDILKQINAGEVSGVQFKERILDKYDIACELVAFRIFLFNNAIYLLPYTGVGSGIQKYKKVNKR